MSIPSGAVRLSQAIHEYQLHADGETVHPKVLDT
jgi:hypothetical protein